MEACNQFYSAKYVRLPGLFAELAIARNEGIYKKVLHQYRKVNLLILDEWMLVSLTETLVFPRWLTC
jgi:DNA replication protein DnaC